MPLDNTHQDMDGQATVLPVGSRLSEFEITALVGQGGFGTVYEARDHALQRVVAIKEYLPVSLSVRRDNGTVAPLSQDQRETFELGMRSFINEARLLAQFDHPSLLKVYRFWQERGTAYMAMPLYRGRTLRQALDEMPDGASESFLLQLVDDLTQALAVMHRANCYHRDIAPDNILLLEDSNRPVLLDFGAARRVIANKTQAITTILKPDYAPIEQYAKMPDTPQGAWTDVYALAAVLHMAVTGCIPPPSVARLLSDSYTPLATNPRLCKRFSTRLLAAIDAGLAVRPEARPQSIAAFRQLLDLDQSTTAPTPPTPSSTGQRAQPVMAPATQKPRKAAPRGKGRRITTGVAILALLLLSAGVGGWLWGGKQLPDSVASKSPAIAAEVLANPPPVTEEKTPQPPTDQTASGQPSPPASQEQTPENPVDQTTEAQPSPPATQEQTPQNPPAQAEQPALATQEQTPENPVDQTTEAQPPPPATQEQTPQDPASQTAQAQPSVPAQAHIPEPPLAALAQGAASEFEVRATPRQSTVRVGKDKLGFKIQSNRAGHVYVFLLSTHGDLTLLFPNLLDKENQIKAKHTLALPRASWPMIAGRPPGVNHFAVLVSQHERDFASSGLRGNAVFRQFSRSDLAALETPLGDQPSPLLGRPVCKSGTTCRDVYGVKLFEITGE